MRTPQNFFDFLSYIKPLVFTHTKKYLHELAPDKHRKIVSEYPVRQGKYTRPGLLLLANSMFGGDFKQVIPLAAVVQTAEDWMLIHDDVEDHATERRSSQKQKKRSLNELYGYEHAVNAGDALHVLMWSMMEEVIKNNPKLGLELHKDLVAILQQTIEGQFLELEWRLDPKLHMSLDQYLEIVKKKTTGYSVVGPVILGAKSSGKATKTGLAWIKRWGQWLGYAYQMWDDVLDVDQTATQTGKKKFQDIQESKPTAILLHAYSKATQSERTSMLRILRKPIGTKTSAEVGVLLELLHAYGSVDYAKNLARSFRDKAVQEFKKGLGSVKNPEVGSMVIELMDFVVSRGF